jgi:hypothetical protein
MATVANTAKAAYELWQAEQAAINVTVSAKDKTWTFYNNGTLTVPGAIRKDGGLYLNSGGTGVSSTVFVNGTAGSVILRTDNGTTLKSLTLDVEGLLTFPDGTTSTGKSITVPLDDSLTVNLSFDSGPSNINTSFKVNPLSIKLPTGNGNIYSNGETAAERWSLDSANKTFYFPDAGDGVSPQIRYSTPGNDGMQLFTAAKPIKITTASNTNWTFGTDGALTLPSGGALDANFVGGQWIDVWLTAPQGATKTAGVRDFFGKTVAYAKENSFVIESNRAIAPKVWTFSESGDITLPASGNVVNSTGVSQLANRVEGTWTVTTGTNNYSFTVPANGTYTMWVRGNIPNGIIVWNATVTITNTNVPVVGQQFAWVYDGAGNPLDFTSIPSQIVGTPNTILRSYISSGTTNEFIFGIANTSGASQTVYYGYTKI